MTARGVQILNDAAPAWEACQAAIESRLGKKQLAALQKIHEGVAFIGEEFSVKAQLDKLTPFSKQIEDFRADNVSKQIEKK